MKQHDITKDPCMHGTLHIEQACPECYKLLLDECKNLRAEIGELSCGQPPEELNPRAITWMQERSNWEEEVAALRHYKSPFDNPEVQKTIQKLQYTIELLEIQICALHDRKVADESSK